jgi:hypothetical protein
VVEYVVSAYVFFVYLHFSKVQVLSLVMLFEYVLFHLASPIGYLSLSVGALVYLHHSKPSLGAYRGGFLLAMRAIFV